MGEPWLMVRERAGERVLRMRSIDEAFLGLGGLEQRLEAHGTTPPLFTVWSRTIVPGWASTGGTTRMTASMGDAYGVPPCSSGRYAMFGTALRRRSRGVETSDDDSPGKRYRQRAPHG
jgi:hypothetical protein